VAPGNLVAGEPLHRTPAAKTASATAIPVVRFSLTEQHIGWKRGVVIVRQRFTKPRWKCPAATRDNRRY
jgi:hypothetical protein